MFIIVKRWLQEHRKTLLSQFRLEVQDVQRSLSPKLPSRERSPTFNKITGTEACCRLHDILELYFTPTEEPTEIQINYLLGNEGVVEEKMSSSKSIEDPVKVQKDAGLIYYYNSKQFKTLLIKRQDDPKLASFLLEKLEKVEKVWKENQDVCEFPFRNSHNLTVPALSRMLNFFWDSKFCIVDKKNSSKHKFWRQNVTGVGDRISFTVYKLFGVR